MAATGKDIIAKEGPEAIKKKYQGSVWTYSDGKSTTTGKCFKVEMEKTIVMHFKPWVEHDAKGKGLHGYSDKTPDVQRLSDLTSILPAKQTKFTIMTPTEVTIK